MAKKWYNWEMFVCLENGVVNDFHLNKNVEDVTNNTSFHRVSFPVDKWKYNNFQMPKSVKEISSVTLGNDGSRQYNGFFVAFEITSDDPRYAYDEACHIYEWLKKNRKFW